MNNIVIRTISGIGFVALIVASLLIDKFIFAGLIIVIETLMMLEFYSMTMGRKFMLAQVLAIIAGVVLFILFFLICAYGLPLKYISLTVLPASIVMIDSLYVKDKEEFWKFSFIYTGILYISIPLALSNYIVFNHSYFNGLMLLCFFIIIWSSDVGAYVFGVSFGKNGKKLFPSISPKKSWAGFWGGLLCSMLTAIVLGYMGFIDIPLIHCIFMAVIMDIAGVYGDLFESQWKRSFDIKDSGSIIPGHGGLLDRFDSSLMAIPAGVLYLVVFNLM